MNHCLKLVIFPQSLISSLLFQLQSDLDSATSLDFHHHVLVYILKCCFVFTISIQAGIAASFSKCSFMFALWISHAVKGVCVRVCKRGKVIRYVIPTVCIHIHIYKTNIKGDAYLLKAHLNPLSFTATPIYAVFSICSIYTESVWGECCTHHGHFQWASYATHTYRETDILMCIHKNMFTLDVMFSRSSKSYFNMGVIDVNERSLEMALIAGL